MSNFDIHSFLKNQYINEAINSKLNSNEMSKEEDAKILISAVGEAVGEIDDRFGGGGYNGRDGYYLRVYNLEYWNDKEVNAVKKAFEIANTQTEKYDFEFYSVTDYDEDPGERTYPASISFFAVDKPVNEMDMNDPVLVKMRADKVKMDKFEKDQEQKIQNAKRGGAKEEPLRKLADMGKIAFLEKEKEQLMRDMEQEAEPEGGPIADEYGSKLNRIDKAIAKLKGRKEMTYDQAIAEGHSLEDKDIEVLKDAFNVLFVQNPDWKGSSDLRRIIQNLIDTNDVSGIQEIAETIKLGEGMIEEELCAKGKAYRKRRMAAGEKSSAYLSGRAVKVCKGQMSGKKKKK